MKKIFLWLLLIIVTASSCHYMFAKRVRGNGTIKTETRTAGQFTAIDVSGSINVYAKQDSVSSIRIEADENLMEYIRVDNEGGTIRIHEEEGFNLRPTKEIRVYVSGPSFKRFEASGACDIYSENKITNTEAITISLSGACDVKMEVNAPKVSADLSGAGTIDLRGDTKELWIDGSGSTDVKCFEMMSENTHVEISGAGDAEVHASVKLDVHVSGAGSVRYKGNASVNQDVSGAGSVKKVE